MYNREYIKLLDDLRSIRGRNQKENRLLKLLEKVVYLDTNNKIILSMLDEDSHLNILKNSINEEIERLELSIKDSLRYYKDGSNLEKEEEKLKEYKKLKNRINTFYNEQNILIDEKDILIKDCYDAIKKCTVEPISKDKKIINYRGDHYKINNQAISELNTLLKDKDFISEVSTGVELVKEQIRLNNYVNDCKDILNKKDVLLNNSNLIIEFNTYIYMLRKYRDKLNSSKYKDISNEINELNHKLTKNSMRKNKNGELDYYLLRRDLLFSRVEEIEEIKRNSHIIRRKMNSIYEELCSLGLKELLFDTYNDNNNGVLNIAKTLKDLDSKEELEEYFDKLEQEKENALEELRKVLDKQEIYMKTVGIHTLDYVYNHYESAKTLVNINEKDNDKNMEISPRLAVSILNVVSEGDKDNSIDIDLSDYEYKDLEKWYEENLLGKIHEFEDEYYGICFDVNKRDKDVINSNKSSSRLKK